MLPAVLGTSNRGWVRHLLGWRLLAWLGLVSYGIYLWHSTVFALLAKWGLGDLLSAGAESYVLWPLAGLGGAVVLAAASWYLIERPALSLKRLVRQRPRDDQAISAVTLAEAAAEAAHPHDRGLRGGGRREREVSTLDVAAPRAGSAPPALAPPPGHQRFPHVDALRAIAALAIVAVHISALSRVTYDSAVGAYTARLNVGVPIFFCISGFLLYRPFVAAAREAPADPATRLCAQAHAADRARLLGGAHAARDLAGAGRALRRAHVGVLRLPAGVLRELRARRDRAGVDAVHRGDLLPAAALLRAGVARLTAGRDGARGLGIELAVLAALSVATLVYRPLLFNHPGPQIAASTLPGTFDWFAVGMALAVVSVAAHGREDAWAVFRWVRRWPWLPWLLAAVAFWRSPPGSALPALTTPTSTATAPGSPSTCCTR